MTKILGYLILCVIGIPVTLLGGVVLSDLWDWFIVPVFSAPAVTYLQAVGLLLVASIFKMGLEPVQIGTKEDALSRPILVGAAKQVGYTVAYLVLWGIAAIWSLFV